MKRRWQFSVKALLLMLTGISVWLALVCQHARRQAETVSRIKALGGIVYFEHQDLTHGRRTQIIAGQVVPAPCYDRFREPPVSPWLRKRLGDDFFREAAVVDLSKIEVSDAEVDQLRASLPYASFRCPASYARSHGVHNIGPITNHRADPFSLAVSLVSLAFAAWVFGLCWQFMRRRWAE